MKTIAIDFDGVIHKYSKGWEDGTIYDDPMPGALEGIKDLQKEFAVFVFTSRNALDVARWLNKHDVEATYEREDFQYRFWTNQTTVLVTNRKLPAVAYLDDRAIRFKDWTLVYHQLKDVGL